MIVHLPRVRMQRAVAVLLGQGAAANPAPLERVWFDALAEHPEQVDELLWQTNSRRAELAALRRRGVSG